MNADMKREILRKTILELLTKDKMHYTYLEKKICATCLPFSTTNTFKSQLQYLLSNSYIIRVSRGIYQITARGKKYLELLTV